MLSGISFFGIAKTFLVNLIECFLVITFENSFFFLIKNVTISIKNSSRSERMLEEISKKIPKICFKYDNLTKVIVDNMEELNRMFQEEVYSIERMSIEIKRYLAAISTEPIFKKKLTIGAI